MCEIMFMQQQLMSIMKSRLDQITTRFNHLKVTLSPVLIRHQLDLMAQRIDHLSSGLTKFTNRMDTTRNDLESIRNDLGETMIRVMQTKQTKLNALSFTLDALSPLKILNRGYSMSLDQHNHPITSIDQINPGQTIITRLKDGSFESMVNTITTKE